MIGIWLILLAAAPAPTGVAGASVRVELEAPTAQKGRLAVARVSSSITSPLATVEVHLGKHPAIAFPSTPDQRTWMVLAPIDIDEKAKSLPLLVDAVHADGRRSQAKLKVAVLDGKYDRRQLTVGKEFLKPSFEQRRRAAREAKELKTAQSSSSSERLWHGSFSSPVKGGETSPFGTLRTYNNKRRSRHMGLDLDGATGDPIVASNRGRIALATERFYSGGTVLVDHGQGMMTMYFHMSRIDVHEGDRVEKGQQLGLVGASGQVTGPHLHFTLRVGGLSVDPAQLLRLDLSADIAEQKQAVDGGAPSKLPSKLPSSSTDAGLPAGTAAEGAQKIPP